MGNAIRGVQKRGSAQGKVIEYHREYNAQQQCEARVNVFKNAWIKAGRPGSLKEFARNQAKDQGSGLKTMAVSWLHNKKVNASKPTLGWGKTRRKKGKGGAKEKTS